MADIIPRVQGTAAAQALIEQLPPRAGSDVVAVEFLATLVPNRSMFKAINFLAHD